MSSTLVTPSPASTDDGPATAELHRLLAAQRAAFFADPFPGANGQMCISVDYTLVPRTDLDAFVGHAEDMFADDLAGINAGERPLGLYVYSDDAAVADHVLDRTTSGGVCINVCALQGALPSLGFGGIGNSGTGRHHGIDGFREFSNPRGVVVRGTDDIADAFLPPNGSLAEAVVEGAFAATSGSDAPAHDAR
jgi:acyl-CoA reductase-like NAD-dependent aldehyde dehydrogenase